MSSELSSNLSGLFAIARECAHTMRDPADLLSLAKSVLAISGASLVAEFDHTFVPHGLTIVLVAAESHLVLSTWPEFRTATLDMALCGTDVDPMKGWSHLVAQLQPTSTDVATRSWTLD